MGSDVRVEEMLRQIRHILGAERVDFSVMSQNFDFSKGYFEGTRQVSSAGYFPAIFIQRGSQTPRCCRLRRLNVQKQVRECANNHDDWIFGHRRGPEQMSVGLRRRSRTHGSAGRQDVCPLLQEFAGHHA